MEYSLKGKVAVVTGGEVKLIARMFDLVSVCGSIGAAALCGLYLPNLYAWFFGAFFATLTFVALDSVQLGIVSEEDRKR